MPRDHRTGGGVSAGFLLAADISGYTEFLTGSELDHAHEIVRDVMRLISRALSPPLEILKYEGDAVFGCVLDGALRDPMLLLDVIEQTYVAFTDRLFDIQRGSTCPCRACTNAKSLDLKFFLHSGRFVVEDVGKGRDVSGPDVILLHRLMKNRVSKEKGLRAYALATSGALERLGAPRDFAAHEETYEHFGAVPCGVLDLRPALEARRAAREIRVGPEAATAVVDRIVAADPVKIWDYFFDSEKRKAWDAACVGLEMQWNERGRHGVGASLHCNHGDFVALGTTLDWKPFRYFTQEYKDPQGKMPLPPFLFTTETEPLPDGRTRVRFLYDVRTRNPMKWLMVRQARKHMEKADAAALACLDELVRNERAAPPPRLSD